MTYAMVYAENGDVVGTYASREDAVERLAAFIELHPEIQDDIGLRAYEQGLPTGPYEPAVHVLGDRVIHPHLASD
jgi:hypothetical protein